MKEQTLPRGLSVRNRSIVATFNCNGVPQRRVVGMVGVSSLNDCLRKRLEFLHEVELGTYKPPMESNVGKSKKVLVSDVWAVYLKDAEVNAKRVDRMRQAWAHLKPVFGHLPADGIRPLSLKGYQTGRLEADANRATVNRELACLRAALRLAARLEMIAAVCLFPSRMKESKREGFIEQAQYVLLAANCDELWLRTFLAIGFSYGWRKSEILGLRVCNVDFLGGWLSIETSKNGQGRKVALTAEVKSLLVECVHGKSANDFVLTHADGSRVVQPRKNWYSLCARCGLGKFEKGRYVGLQMHDLRRSAVKRLVDLGIPERTCMEITGHLTRSVFDRYNIQNGRNMRNAAKVIDADAGVSRSKTDTESSTSVFAHS